MRIQSVLLAAVVAASLFTVAPERAQAAVKLVAVLVPRSAPSLVHDANIAAKQLATKINALDGYEARVLPDNGNAGQSAARIGAEEYVVGQLVNDGSEHVILIAHTTADDTRLGSSDVSFGGGHLSSGGWLAQLLGSASTSAMPRSNAASPNGGATIDIPSGQEISVIMLGDIGSRISQQGDSFAVQTTEDFYVDGKLVAPKGSPGYGQITHLKRAGSWHAGGELNFVVKRIVTPSGKDLAVDTTGPTADANKDTEHNGNEFGQYLLFGGLGVFSHRGNDILIKKGTQFHVYTVSTQSMPAVNEGTAPAALDQTLITPHG